MSTLWLEPFIFDPTDSNIFTFQSVNIVIYLNMVSIICFVIYSLIYKMDYNMQKPPNSLIIWKMFGECLISVHLLILFLCFAIENNKRKMDLTKYIMWVVSIISPLGLFIVYFFTGTIAQNLYCTFHNYKNDFEQRMQKYKIYALVFGIIILLVSVIFNENNLSNTGIKFSIKYYPQWYIALLYFAGALGMIFILIKTLFVVKKKTSFFSFMSKNTETDDDSLRHTVVSLFISRHLMFCYVFILCFLPNNFILILQIFVSVKVCNDCRVYSFMIYLISLSCTFSFIIKMTEPYMKKYIQVVFSMFIKKNSIEQTTEDYCAIYNNENNQSLIDNKDNEGGGIMIEGNNNPKHKEMELLINSEEAKLNSMADTVEIVTREMQTNDFYKSLISLFLAISDDSILDQNDFLLQYSDSYLPWDDSIYNEKSKLISYCNKDLRSKLGSIDELNDPHFLEVKIRKYAPRIFHHFRTIDNISNNDFINSLHPLSNLKIIKESFASGGRSANPIIFTHDKKLLLKTISKREKDILIKILPEFHRRMRDCQSLLCRIYGVYRIEVSGKQSIHLIVMRNMNELPSETKVACFDLKGSTVNRTSLSKMDKDQILKGFKKEIVELSKKKILKDLDFDILNFDFPFDKDVCHSFQNSICEDSEFLKGNNLIDYSMLLSIHKYRQEDEDKIDPTQRYRILKTKDEQYLYNISIIDFLTPYTLTKQFELGIKTAGAVVSDNKDRNFSVMDSTNYSRRFIRYLNSHIKPQ